MPIESIVTLVIAMFVLAVLPGPGTLAVASHSLSFGFRSSAPMIAGIVLGDLLFLLLAISGLSALAIVLGELFTAIRMLGAAYLVWLGINLWRAPAPTDENQWSKKRRAPGQTFLSGLLLTLGNPKVILFYAGILPTLLDLNELTAASAATAAVVVSSVLSLVLAAYSLFAARAGNLWKSSAARRNVNRGAGALMIGTGVTIALKN